MIDRIAALIEKARASLALIGEGDNASLCDACAKPIIELLEKKPA
jgi:hypothetical protein